jgi:hypothetical protein
MVNISQLQIGKIILVHYDRDIIGLVQVTMHVYPENEQEMKGLA